MCCVEEVIQGLIDAAVASKSSARKQTYSISTSDIHFKSAKSMHSDTILCDNESGTLHLSKDIAQAFPGLGTVINMAAEGELELSDEFLQELYNVNCRVDDVGKVNNELQQRWREMDTKVGELQSSFHTLKKEAESEIHHVRQYEMIDNLLLHKFPPPSVQMTSLEFCQYVANELKKFLTCMNYSA